MSWLDRQDMRAAQQHWFGKLAGFAGPVRLDAKKSIHCADGPEDRYRDYDFDIPIDIGELKAFTPPSPGSTEHRGSGAWALLLGRRSGRDDLIFGVTVSCRPGELPGIENSAGLFINTLPLRVKIEPRREMGALVARAAHQTVEAFPRTLRIARCPGFRSGAACRPTCRCSKASSQSSRELSHRASGQRSNGQNRSRSIVSPRSSGHAVR